MFDDPKKSLDRLQRELLQAEQDVSEDPDAALAEMREFLAEEDARTPLDRAYARGFGEPDVEYADVPEPETNHSGRGNRGLVIAVILETLGLLALAGWWLLWR